jgi:hypothetical protein
MRRLFLGDLLVATEQASPRRPQAPSLVGHGEG